MLLMTLAATAAFAEPVLLVEGATSVATLGEGARVLGSGGGAHLGMRWGSIVELIPEAGVTVWSCDHLSVIPDVGLRFRAGRVFKPGIYGHVGYLIAPNGGFGGDAGLSLDAVALSWLTVGLRGGAQLYGKSPVLTAGAQLEISLGWSEAQKERRRERMERARERARERREGDDDDDDK